MLEGSEGMKMKAVQLDIPCTWEEIQVSEVPVPVVKPGWVLIKVMAFGLNHSELVLRRNEIKADYIKKPVIPGIECVGLVEDPSDSGFKTGDKVVALMGGMGRSFDGSYCEYALLPEHHVFKVDTDMDWNGLAAVPETFYTAYGSLFSGLQLKKEDRLLIHGGTSALGIAAIQLARTVGCEIIATTRQEHRLDFLKEVGANRALLDNDKLYDQIRAIYGQNITKVLELVGGSCIPETGKILKHHSIICVTGQLGNKGGGGLDLIKNIPNSCYITSFHSNFPAQNDLDAIIEIIRVNAIKPVIGQVFDFEEIGKAHEYLEKHIIPGKLIVKVR